jgi:hypothetical protein
MKSWLEKTNVLINLGFILIIMKLPSRRKYSNNKTVKKWRYVESPHLTLLSFVMIFITNFLKDDNNLDYYQIYDFQ